MKQNQYNPLGLTEQVISIFSGTHGYLDPINKESIERFEQELLTMLKANHKALLDSISEEKSLGEAQQEELHAALKKFSEYFI